MNKLPENFELDKYGLHVRLVNEDDAEFILKLRTDPKLSRFIHSTDNDLEKQKEWIREYKKREKEGKEYYFIFDMDSKSVGVYRIYDINYNYREAEIGSVIISKDAKNGIISILMNKFILAYAFKKLGLNCIRGNVREENIGSRVMTEMIGFKLKEIKNEPISEGSDNKNFYKYILEKKEYDELNRNDFYNIKNLQRNAVKTLLKIKANTK